VTERERDILAVTERSHNDVPDPWEPHCWDARWNKRQRADALALAEEAVADARSELDKVIREIDAYAAPYREALKWLATAAYFKAMADARDDQEQP
jgi:hypothetical protein